VKELVAQKADLLLITLDTLRYDAAHAAWREGRLPTLAPYLGPQGWQQRHSPASFTYAAHQAFLSGFLPTPLGAGPHPRLFAAEFAGSASTTADTFTFAEALCPRRWRPGDITRCASAAPAFSTSRMPCRG